MHFSVARSTIPRGERLLDVTIRTMQICQSTVPTHTHFAFRLLLSTPLWLTTTQIQLSYGAPNYSPRLTTPVAKVQLSVIVATAAVAVLGLTNTAYAFNDHAFEQTGALIARRQRFLRAVDTSSVDDDSSLPKGSLGEVVVIGRGGVLVDVEVAECRLV
ncbi:unnamed protein product [Phytophthora lilii]|uniref:Unnamed protein product n=1 Tax=Phytophthora lilii TaxID=2077276 RepID=A0A9W6XLD0_9STRA|nr:unnamed protein product [Phytophthora lilii]